MTDETPETETKTYVDGTIVTGLGPLPELSPSEQAFNESVASLKHKLTHIEEEFKKWLASAEHEASAILAGMASKI